MRVLEEGHYADSDSMNMESTRSIKYNNIKYYNIIEVLFVTEIASI